MNAPHQALRVSPVPAGGKPFPVEPQARALLAAPARDSLRLRDPSQQRCPGIERRPLNLARLKDRSGPSDQPLRAWPGTQRPQATSPRRSPLPKPGQSRRQRRLLVTRAFEARFRPALAITMYTRSPRSYDPSLGTTYQSLVCATTRTGGWCRCRFAFGVEALLPASLLRCRFDDRAVAFVEDVQLLPAASSTSEPP